MNQQQLAGNWNEIKGALKKKWGQLTDQDLKGMEGNLDQLIGLLQRKTGETREKIEQFLGEISPESLVQQVASSTREYVEKAGEQVGQAYDQVAERVQQGYETVEERIQNNPAQSVAVAFGAGILAGLLVGVLLRSR